MELCESGLSELPPSSNSHASSDRQAFCEGYAGKRTAPALVLPLLFVSCVLLGTGCTVSSVRKYDVTDHTGKVHQNLSKEFSSEGCTHFEDSDGKTYIFSGAFTAMQRKQGLGDY